MKHLLAALTLVLLAACAPSGPVTLSCSAMGLSKLQNGGTPVELAQFEIQSPAEGDWCEAQKDGQSIVYSSHSLFGRTLQFPLSVEETANTLALQASTITATGPKIHDVSELEAYVERWFRAGGQIDVKGDQVFVELTQSPRFSVLDLEVEIATNIEGDCVRYEILVEERDNPLAHGKVLNFHVLGVICRALLREDDLIVAELSERYVREHQYQPELFGRLQTDVAEPFFSSIALKKR